MMFQMTDEIFVVRCKIQFTCKKNVSAESNNFATVICVFFLQRFAHTVSTQRPHVFRRKETVQQLIPMGIKKKTKKHHTSLFFMETCESAARSIKITAVVAHSAVGGVCECVQRIVLTE